MDVRGRVVLVTGAGRRVGRAIATSLGALGARVAVHYHGSSDGASETAAAITAAGGEAWTVRADLRDAAAPGVLVAEVARHFGALDVLVNSSAVMQRTPFGETTVEDWDAMFALNTRAPYFLAQAAAPHLTRARGVIINIADLAAFETWPGYVPHCLTKGAVVHMTRALARVLAPDVRVCAVAPGTVLLPDDWGAADAERMRSTTPLQRNGTPEDVAQAVRYLLEADYVTGETLIVDGGRHARH
ncbi:MAG TPA: SDR family oxidoreductase [Gemmatimonadaceae bacterium]|nr:SDR family oxidoreductase [Gemmatimonadaceae bacterium]